MSEETSDTPTTDVQGTQREPEVAPGIVAPEEQPAQPEQPSEQTPPVVEPPSEPEPPPREVHPTTTFTPREGAVPVRTQ